MIGKLLKKVIYSLFEFEHILTIKKDEIRNHERYKLIIQKFFYRLKTYRKCGGNEKI